MNPSLVRSSLRLLVVVFVTGLIHACGRDRGPDVQRSSTELASPSAANAAVADLVEGPLTTFDRACSRCHGPQGSFYGSSFEKLSDDQLHHSVEEMMRGPAQLEPTALQIDAMAAYQRALRDHRPFICVTNAAAFTSRQETALHGEATPGASVTLAKGSATLPARVDQQTWSIAAPPRPPFTLRAEAGGANSKLNFPARLWSE